MFIICDSICIIVFIRLILLGFLESAVDKNSVEELFKREMVVLQGRFQYTVIISFLLLVSRSLHKT
jgi:hypothetical protein